MYSTAELVINYLRFYWKASNNCEINYAKCVFQLWNKSYKESRAKSGFYKFNVDSLFIVPFTGGKEKWKFSLAKLINTVKIYQFGYEKRQTIILLS